MTDEELMRAALDEAKIAADLGEVPVGAVVAKDGEIVARAHNLRESGKNATYHAELMAIDAACKTLGGWRLWQCELFVTLEPCPMCSGAIINSRLKRVVYGARDPKAGCCGSLTDLFALPFNHHPVIESGLLEDEAQALLQNFFVMLREKRKKKLCCVGADSISARGGVKTPPYKAIARGCCRGEHGSPVPVCGCGKLPGRI